jgi:hypothetical protein
MAADGKAETTADEWDDDRNPDLDECEHEHAEVDILTGELSCHCGYHRYLSGDELRRGIEIQTEAEAYYRECGDEGRVS